MFPIPRTVAFIKGVRPYLSFLLGLHPASRNSFTRDFESSLDVTNQWMKPRPASSQMCGSAP
ncbi:hypothetical protein BJX99DRAFT_235426, partial [Aspergillus californicus]